MVNLDRLLTWLNQSGLQQSNQPTYQVIKTLIEAAQEFQKEQSVVNTSSGTSVATLQNRTYWTKDDETPNLPSSRQVLAGTGVSLDYSVASKVTINVAGATGIDHVVMSDGNQPPTPLDDGNGNFIYIPYG